MTEAVIPRPDPARFLPAFAVFLFLLHLGWVLVEPGRPLADPGTGWHVKLGELMVREVSLPRTDPLSYTLPGKEWIDYQWFSHALMGVLHGLGGLPVVTAVWSVFFGIIPVMMVRRLMGDGVPVLVSWFLSFAAYLVLVMHAQVRPHVATYVFLVLLTTVLARGGGQRWFLPPLFVVWCNTHAGFTAGLMVLACYAAGDCLATLVERRRLSTGRILSWGVLGSACGLATLVNPWGWRLHLHILDHLGMDMVAHMNEYQPVWRSWSAGTVIFALMAVAWAVTAIACFRRLRAGEMAAGLVLLLFAIGAVRHVNLFVIAALPVIGQGLRFLQLAWRPASVGASDALRIRQLGWAATWGYVLAAAVVFFGLSLAHSTLFRRDFRDMQVSGVMLDAVAKLPPTVHLAHPENLGGTLAYTFGPELRVFVDDRLDYYGDAFFFGTYFPVLKADPQWRDLLEKHGIAAALVPLDSGLHRALGLSPDWEEVAADPVHALWVRKRP